MKISTTSTAMCAALLLMGAVAMADSCWPQSGSSLFADNKAWRVGDVVTVIVVEEASVTNEAGTSQSKASNTDATVEALDWPGAQVFPGAGQPHVAWNAARTFDGRGSYELKGTMSTRLTAVVEEVLPNGNLLIDGSRLRTSVDDKVTVRISGIVRPQDISAANTVLSTSVAQGKIVFDSTGPIARSNRRGFLDRLVDIVWPF